MQAKRSLSQNFLSSSAIAGALADAVTYEPDGTVLEIGPGKGIVTKELLGRAKKVVAIEKDDDLFVTLQDTFSDEIASGQLQLVHGDALDLSAKDLGLKNQRFSIAANIPYNITGALLRHLLSDPVQPKSLAFLVQKEVAQRIVARDSKESILSLSVKAYGTPKYVKTVKAGSFHPKPRVDSAIFSLSNISRDNFSTAKHEERYFELVKAGFAQKRKKLAGNLRQVMSGEDIEKALEACSVSPSARAETLSLQQWLCIAAR